MKTSLAAPLLLRRLPHRIACGVPRLLQLLAAACLFAPSSQAQPFRVVPDGSYTVENEPHGIAPLGVICPTGTSIPNFRYQMTKCGSTTSITFFWSAPAGANDATQYEFLRSSLYLDYCAAPSSKTGSFSIVGTTSSTTFTLTVPDNAVFIVFVRVRFCTSIDSVGYLIDSFTAPEAAPIISAAATAINQVTLNYQQTDGRTFGLYELQRSFNGGTYARVSGFPGGVKNYCPINSTKSYVDGNLAAGTYSYRVIDFGDNATCFTPVTSNVATVEVGSTCPTPGAPRLTSPTQALTAGAPLALGWTAASGLLGGHYLLESSTDGFKNVSTITTTALSTVLPTGVSAADTALSVRVRGIQGCGTAGDVSNVLTITLKATPATFILSRAGPTWLAKVGDPRPTALVSFRNIGGVGGRLSLSASGGFYGFTPSFLDIPAGGEGSATLTATPEAVAAPGQYSGRLDASYQGGDLATAVQLSVVPSLVNRGIKVRSSTSEVLFSAPEGSDPAPQTITLNVSPVLAGTYLVPSVGPGGAWLELSNAFSGPVPGSGQVQLTLTARRSNRLPADGVPLARTVLKIAPAGGDPERDSAVVEVFDLYTLNPGPGAGTRGGTGAAREPLAAAAPAGGSFIIPTGVRAVSGITGAAFTSDGWLRNLSGAPVTADLFCTADGKNGLSDPSVAKTTLTLEPGGTFRLSDLMQTVFKANNISAQIEVRSPFVSALSVRSTVDSILGSDPTTRFGSEIPTVSYGSGVALGDPELIIPGIDDDVKNRANLILDETTGADVLVKIDVHNSDGGLVGTMTKDVPAYSKVQINDVVEVVAATPGTTLSGGWLGVSVTAGTGRVVAVATVIDNASGSFSALLGQSHTSPALVGTRSRGPLAVSQRYLLPTVVRTLGLFNTQFTTSMSLVNGTAQPVTLNMTYNYVDQDDGNAVKSVTKPFTLPARGTMPKSQGSDIIANFFGVTHRSFGSIYMDGDLNRITAVASVSALVDPADPSKGLKTSQVNGTFLDAPAIMASGEAERRFAGLEKSFQKRSNLVLLEVDGKPVQVMVRLYASTGEKMAEQSFGVAAGQYFQINDVFGPGGVNLGDGPFQNVEVTAQVASGDGRVLALATVNDNVSRNPEIFVLTLPAPPTDPGAIGF